MPPPPTKGTENEPGFLMWVGYRIATWADVEEQLFHICWAGLQSTQEQAAIIYFRTPTIDAKIKLVEELMKQVLPKPARHSGGHDQPDFKKWKRLNAEVLD